MDASTILKKLETREFADIDTSYATLLRPFSLHISPPPQNPNKKPPKSSQLTSIRSLVKTYLNFINKSLHILPRILSESPKHLSTVQFHSQLLASYRLCINCLDIVSNELVGPVYGVYLKRARFLNCLLRWDKYDEGFDEGVRVLRELGDVELVGFRFRVLPGEIVPKVVDCGGSWEDSVEKEGSEGEFVMLVVDLVDMVSKCVSIGKGKDAGKYSGLLVITEEVRPWFRHMEDSAIRKLQLKLLALMKNFTKYMISEAQSFDGDLVSQCCAATFDEYTRLLSNQTAKDRTGEELNEFVQFLYMCVYKCRMACKNVQFCVARHLYDSAGNFSQELLIYSLIQRLYAMGLYLSEFGDSKGLNDGCSLDFLPKGWEKLQTLCNLLISCKSYFHSNSEAYASFYFNAMKFVCGPLAQFVHNERKRIVREEIVVPSGNALQLIQETFAECCYVFSLCQERKADPEEIDKTVISISIASYTLSLKLSSDSKGGKKLVDLLLSDGYRLLLQPQMLNYMVHMLHKVFLECYRYKQLKEASKAGKLYCRALWSRCVLLCEINGGNVIGSEGLVSDKSIADSVDEACKENSLLLDILHITDNQRANQFVVDGLEKWCLARNLFGLLPCPETLIKRWCKIQCSVYAPSDANAPTLGSFLLNSAWIKKHNVLPETVGLILKQELIAYQDLSNIYPKFCQRMQMVIIDTLLLKVHTLNNCMQRSIALTKKGMLLRSLGDGDLENCVHFLSEAIDTIDGSSDMSNADAASPSHLLAIFYCLRALCSQECNPDSEDFFIDIRKAVEIWLMSDFPNHVLEGDNEMGWEYVLSLLYYIADLLSMKGDAALHLDLLSLILKVLKQLNVSLDKCLALLWESRRTNHALCASPVNEGFLAALSKHYGKEAESFEFWISCVKDSQALSVGLKQSFLYWSSHFSSGCHQHKNLPQSEISVDDVILVASNLISDGSVSGCSTFIAGYLLYDASERLCSRGKMIQALSYAKKAHRLRSKLLHEHFSLSYKQTEVVHDEADEAIRKSSRCLSQIVVLSHVAVRAWPNHANILEKSDEFFLTPWNVLRSFLESSLQVGVINEALGNVAEAEAQFSTGKCISCLQNLPLFVIAFSSWLGKVYYRKGLFDLAHRVLGTAQKGLATKRNPSSCSRCLLIFESSISEELGNLYRKGLYSAATNPYELSLRSLISLEKGDFIGWLEKGYLGDIMLEELALNAESGTGCRRATLGIRNETAKARPEARKPRKSKRESESLAGVKPGVTVQSLRVTRSRKQSLQCNETECVEMVHSATDIHSNCQQERASTSVCNWVVCVKCFLCKIKNVGSFACFIQLKWEYARRRQILRLLIGLGKYRGACVANLTAQTIYTKCLTILLGGNDCHCLGSSLFDFNSVIKQIPGESWATECAEVFYHLSWSMLKQSYSQNIRSVDRDVLFAKRSQVVSFLIHAFVLSREMPLVFQKVSRLLSLTYLISVTREDPSSPLPSCEVLTENFWAAYFHQASIGSHYNLNLISAISERDRSLSDSKVEGTRTAAMSGMTAEMHTLLRIVPESTDDIEKHIEYFLKNLPSSAVVCVSVLGDSYASLLEGLSNFPTCIRGWMLLSRFSADSQPVVLLLPLKPILQDDETNSRYSVSGEKLGHIEWRCPWKSSALVDDVAPLFKSVLRGNYLSCSSYPGEDSEKSWDTWWDQRYSLDRCLQNLLREIEDSWIGQWKFLLLGRWLDTESLYPTIKQLMHDIEDRHKVAVNESVLQALVCGNMSTNLAKASIPRTFLEKACCIGCIQYCGPERCSALDEACGGADDVLASLIAAIKNHDFEYCTRREPVVLVLDTDVQMLPWENMPIMREQEVYRMPSVASIFVALRRRAVLKEDARLAARFPLIDPLDSYYLLNPSGDLSGTQIDFEEWFRSQSMQGKAGVIPSIAELTTVLESHDLFLYFGHGSGAQYMPADKVKNLKSCAATLLMGCSSGSLQLNGDYPPVGTPLSYMFAGAPIVIANLWEVTDRDIDRFAKAVLKSFMEERSMSTTVCIQCSLLAEELESINVTGKKGKPKRGRAKQKPAGNKPEVEGGYCFKHKLRAGYFVSQARKACKLPYLIGAAPVCYGVPTGIRKKMDI